jgi:hypothetical protein
MSADGRTLLQRGALGTVCRVEDGGPGIAGPCLERDTRAARCGLRLVARWIVAREARALEALRGVSGVPPLLDWDGRVLRRGWIDAQPLHAVKAGDPRYYREALSRDPGNFAAISGEGAALVEKGALEKARRNLAKLQSLCGDQCPETVALQSTIARGVPPRLAVESKLEGAPASN